MALLPMGEWPQMSGAGEAVLFWIVAALMVAGALGVLLFRKAAYAVLSMVVVMVGLAVLYFALEAPFNGSVQVIVYTGAILMLFLFVIMMIGLGATDGYQEQRRGYIVAGALFGSALAILLVAAIMVSTVPGPGHIPADPYSNVPVTALAVDLFQDHWLTVQVTAALLITAAVGAVLLTHSDNLGPKLSQKTVAKARMMLYKNRGRHIGQLPPPGVWASGNAVDNPAIAGDTLEIAEESVPRVLRIKGIEKPMGEVSPEVASAMRLVRSGDHSVAPWGSNRGVKQSKAWGMAGEKAPRGLQQIRQEDTQTPDVEETK
ncbi:NADH-quinone oxidoreductase subunit J [Actinomyces minihominis]|uniref:NADH-quinone oxidoreductase subunit J n=1 Tax=Actinomyces minihominis TaxID=2002838 RepID=UPI000C077E3E|nr:NADH-quinone oxidoreductase subunit J [Actinomyces minihominis]